VVCDHLDKPVGRFKTKQMGSADGQNGIRSIFEKLKTDKFHRLLIGIGQLKRPA